ncbi:MAG: hypothetical protein K0R54_1388 [Clostridiaceae bacterium]|jgi:hypothetical protein|nr:hypothetical protein [Clostridiaceae bacterium]
MFNLIIKDISIQKKDKTVFIFIFLNILNIFVFQKNYGVSIFLCFLSIYLLTVYANAYDFKYNSELMINSMPVNRNVVVTAKYLSVVIFLICAVAITLVTGIIIHFADTVLISKMMNIDTIVIEFFIVSIYYSIFLPVYFKLGYLKSRWVNFITMGIIGGFISLASEISKNNKIFFGNAELVQNTMLIGISIIFIVVSFLISIKIYFNKEF